LVIFKALQDELVAGPAPRFNETQRAQVKLWLNDRLAELWGLEDWTFRKAATTVTVTGGSNIVTAPSDLGIVLGLMRDDGTPIQYVTPETYFRAHLGQQNSTTTDRFTVVNKQILLDPTPGTGSSSWELYYDKAVTPLVADGDIPAIPSEHHYILVHGATATGSVMVNDFTYQFAEQRWANELDSMRRNYLADQRGASLQWGSASAYGW
jgi:hypothetical protein